MAKKKATTRTAEATTDDNPPEGEASAEETAVERLRPGALVQIRDVAGNVRPGIVLEGDSELGMAGIVVLKGIASIQALGAITLQIGTEAGKVEEGEAERDKRPNELAVGEFLFASEAPPMPRPRAEDADED